jgi:hypothetical protein
MGLAVMVSDTQSLGRDHLQATVTATGPGLLPSLAAAVGIPLKSRVAWLIGCSIQLGHERLERESVCLTGLEQRRPAEQLTETLNVRHICGSTAWTIRKALVTLPWY